jgi:hypothetical protein
MKFDVSDAELQALMRHIASKGYRRGDEEMGAQECQEVCDFVIERSMGCRQIEHSMGCRKSLDLRLLVGGFQDYRQRRECQSRCHWHDLIDARAKQQPIVLEATQTPGRLAKRKQWALHFAAEIAAKTKNRAERFRLWNTETKRSEQTLYRRLQGLDDREKLRI